MADIRQTPVSNYPAYYGAGLLNYINEAASKPFGYENDPVRALTNLLGIPSAVKTLENTAYGMPNVIGSGMATQLRPEAKETVGNLLPMAPAAGRLAAKGAVATGRYLAPELGNMAEQYAARTGLLQSIKPIAPTQSQVMSEFVPNVPAGQELVVMHNLSPQNLQFANKLGGLPIPSLGIGKTSIPYEGFGDITLIAPKEFAIPSAKNPVYRADAYTKRFPAIDYQFNKKSENQFNNIFADLKGKLPDNYRYDPNQVMQNWKDRDYSQLFQSKFLQEKGLLPEKSQFKDDYAFSGEVSARVNNLNKEYSDWLANFDNRLSESGAAPKEKLFKGYTYSGNRMYRDATLDNIVKEMKGGAATENWNYGAGNVRAAVSPNFKKLSEIKNSRGLLTDNKAMGEIKDQTNKAYSDLYARLKEINPKYDANDALLEIAQNKSMGVLSREYDKAPDVLKADIKVFLDSFKGMPTEFFEVKPQRAVGLEEFRGAIIPKNSSQSVRDILQQRGIKDVYEYATPEERASLMKKFGKEMFVGAPIGTGLLSTQQDKRK